MKKFKHILVCGLAVVASAVAVQAQTLTQDWKVTEGLPSADNARWGVGFGGKSIPISKLISQLFLLTEQKRKRFWRGNRAVALVSRVTARAI